MNSVKIPRGSLIYVSLYALHMSRRLWNKPEEFKPERWISHETDDASLASKHLLINGSDDKSMSYLPFSNGPRSCIAQVQKVFFNNFCFQVHVSSFFCNCKTVWPSTIESCNSCMGCMCVEQVMAMMELRAALALFCCHFQLLPTESNLTMVDAESLEKMALTLQMEGGMHLHCIPRKRGTHWCSQ